MRGRRSPAPLSYAILVVGGLLAGSAAVVSVSPPGVANAAEPVVVAVADFGFQDTSGEVRDQTAEHAGRLKALTAAVRQGLSSRAGLTLVSMDCGKGECSAQTEGVDLLSVLAKTAGARYLLLGEVRKMSTLVGGVKFAVLDLASNRPVCDRFLSYRGDTDEAWRRAAVFAAQVIDRNCLP